MAESMGSSLPHIRPHTLLHLSSSWIAHTLLRKKWGWTEEVLVAPVLSALPYTVVPPRLHPSQGCGSDHDTLQLSSQAHVTLLCFSLDALALLTLPIAHQFVVSPVGNSSNAHHDSVRYQQHPHPL